MTTATKKYYVLIPSNFSDKGQTNWQELRKAKTLTSAQKYVDRVFGGLIEAEIWISCNNGVIKVASKKNVNGKWDVVYGGTTDADDQNPSNFHYYLSINVQVSRETFFKYGFRHKKEQSSNELEQIATLDN